MNRRDFMHGGCLLALAALSPAVAYSASLPVARVFVPGYEPVNAFANGRPVLSHPVLVKALSGNISIANPARLLTRVSLSGEVKQAVFPVHGHDVKISPDGRIGVFCGFESANHVAFDAESLDMLALAPSLDIGWRGGGHAVFSTDGHVLLSERAPRAALNGGTPVVRYGRVSVRDPETLAIVDSYSSFGIDPHDLCFLDDGRSLAVANYGSLPLDGQNGLGVPRHVIEACVAVIDTSSGRLLEKFVGTTANAEIRHLAAAGSKVSAIQALLGNDITLAEMLSGEGVAYPQDITAESGINYLPAAPILFSKESVPIGMGAGSDDERLMRHGLSIVFEPAHRQLIASFPSSHRVIVFDAEDGRVLSRIETRRQGLNHPCGIALLPDRRHYVVTGYQQGLHVYEVGTHRLVQEASLYLDFFGHSHITVG